MGSSDKRVAVERAIDETVEVVSGRLKSLEDEKARMPELVKQVEAILARKGRRKRPKQKLTKSQVERLGRLEATGIAPKGKPRSLQPAWWSKVEQLIVVLRRNLVKDAADKIENEINYEVGGFYSWVTPKSVNVAEHHRESREAEENSARWLLKYLTKPWLANYIRAKVRRRKRGSSRKRPGEAEPPIPVCQSKAVRLFGPGEQPVVRGKKKDILTTPQYDVVQTLIEAGDSGLSKDQLVKKSGHGDARKIMKRLANRDSDWKAVLVFPGTPGRGYRIR